MVVANFVTRVMGLKVNSNNSKNIEKEIGQDLLCSFPYFKQKLDYVMFLGAEVYKMKQKEKWLTMDEKKRLRILEEDLELHLRDLYDKCGVPISKERILKSFEEDPELLEQIASALSEFKLSATTVEEKEKEEQKE